MWQSELIKEVDEFLFAEDRNCFYVWTEYQNEVPCIRHSLLEPPMSSLEYSEINFFYLLKTNSSRKKLTLETIGQEIKEDILNNGDNMKSLQSFMTSQIIPNFLKNKNWPDNILKDFLDSSHKFLSDLTDTISKREGKIKLYIPQENFDEEMSAHHKKDMIHRLEATLINWNRQIKELLNVQVNQNESESSGPIEEIDEWTQRKNNLNNIKVQFENPNLQKILDILKKSNSSYLKGFMDIREEIEKGAFEAEDNLTYLIHLRDPCLKMAEVSPLEVPKILPILMHCVRMIQDNSKFYNSEERIAGLLRRISNEIIKRCRDHINLDDMLRGNVEKCMSDLNDCIKCGSEWKETYFKYVGLMNMSSGSKWNFKTESVFAEIDAFVQRCNDLIEICEGQIQFARKSRTVDMPKFSGSRGPEIIAVLEEIKESFIKYLDKIKGSDQNKILDIKSSTRWHDDYNVFKAGMKNLDNRYINLINFAFENINTLKQSVEYLEAFDDLAKRASIKIHVQKQIEKVNEFFIIELRMAEQSSNRIIKQPLHFGHYSGNAVWIKSLLHRIERMKKYYDNLVFIEEKYKTNVINDYNTVEKNLRELMMENSRKFRKFVEEVEEKTPLEKREQYRIILDSDTSKPPAFDKRTTKPVVFESKPDKKGHIESNFDKELLKILLEVLTFKKLSKDGVNSFSPKIEEYVSVKREMLRVFRENVMLSVRDYNMLLDSMSKYEKDLFSQHLKSIEDQKSRGLNHLRWGSAIDSFVKKCREQCFEIYDKLMEFKQNKWLIKQKCEEIAALKFVMFDTKETSELHIFESKQSTNRDGISRRLNQIFNEIRSIMTSTYKHFIDKEDQIQKAFFKHVIGVDNMIETELRKAVKHSFQEFLKAIKGEGTKSNPVLLFKVYIDIEEKKNEFDLMFQPQPIELKDSVSRVLNSATDVLSRFRRLESDMLEVRTKGIAEILKQEKQNSALASANIGTLNITQSNEFLIIGRESVKSFQIAVTEDVASLTNSIVDALNTQTRYLKDYMDPWRNEQIKKVWTQAKEEYFKEMLKNMQVNNFREQVEFYDNMQNEILVEPQNTEMICIFVDTERIRKKIEELINQAQKKQLSKIKAAASAELDSFYKKFDTARRELMPEPLDLQHLKRVRDKWTSLTTEKTQIENKITPLEEVFKLLEDYLVPEEPDEARRRIGLREAFDNFGKMLKEIELRNSQTYIKMKAAHESKLSDFVKEIKENKDNFDKNCPNTTGKDDVELALKLIDGFKEQTEEFRERLERMKFGIDLFGMNFVAPPELQQVEQKIEELRMIWLKKDEWNNRWDQIKITLFKDIHWEEIETLTDQYLAVINEYKKHIKEWGVTIDLRNEIDLLKKTMPIVELLRKPSMRDRHWLEIKRTVNDQFDENGQYFNLKKIKSLQFHKHYDKIYELWEISEEQYKIEAAFNAIKQRWSVDEIEIVELKSIEEKIYVINRKSSDKINEKLEEDLLQLTTMKSNIHAEDFVPDIEVWEKDLNMMIETLDIIMIVQRKFTYFNSIFLNISDELSQLPGDFNSFTFVKNQFKSTLKHMHKNPNSKECLTVEHIKEKFKEHNNTLDVIQRKMKNFLKQKRLKFPRFYFVSDEDMFEMLGKAKVPNIINKHLKKMFEGIKSLNYKQMENKLDKNNKLSRFTEIVSPDKEVVPFLNPVEVNGDLIGMMQMIEYEMKQKLKQKLIDSDKTLQGLPNFTSSNSTGFSNWVRETPGQILIVNIQVEWTMKCKSAIQAVIASMDKKDKDKNEQKDGKNKKNLRKDIWKGVKGRIDSYISDLPKLLKNFDNPTMKAKIVALIVIQVYNREVLEELSENVQSLNQFDWTKYLRFYKQEGPAETMKVAIEQGNASFFHGFEYQGNNGRLVITPLTDRCYLTLTTAMNLKRGGAPQGPAGTGKTETVKDLGKNMGRFVFIFNCSEGLEVKSMKSMFEGFAMTGSWGCFDEFNRIEIEVLSVVAIQIASILDGLSQIPVDQEVGSAILDDEKIPLNKNVSIFITMNPGYAGRTALPDNLKALFRPISMMAPDLRKICEITLKSQGFQTSEDLSKRIDTLYTLMKQQLSQQQHYDFGLRAIGSVLNLAGRIKTELSLPKATGKGKGEMIQDVQASEEPKIVIKAIRDMNDPKLVAEDIPLFLGLLKDLFPDQKIESKKNAVLSMKIHYKFFDNQLDNTDYSVNKILQLYDSKITRHGNMLVGKTMSGKTTTYKILAEAMNSLHEEHPDKYPKVKYFVLNPKSINMQELYGYFNPELDQSEIGVFSYMMDQLCNKDETEDQKWIVFDGPIDTKWIESMNSLLDDNRVLTLLDGNRISLHPLVSLIFEVRDLNQASPATVSRCGMVYMDGDKLEWDSIRLKWLLKKELDGYDEDSLDTLEDFFDKWVEPIMAKKKAGILKTVIPIEDNSLISSMCKLLDAIAVPKNKIDYEKRFEDEIFWIKYEKWFIFAMIWTIGAALDTNCRKEFDIIVRDIEDAFPFSQTVYDCYINVEKSEYVKWEDRLTTLPVNWAPNDLNTPDHKFLVETVDTLRSRQLIDIALRSNTKLLLIGGTGTGKTSIVNSLLQDLDESFTYNIINLSANTTSEKLQEIVQSKLKKPGKKVYRPPGGKSSVIFIDDLNMPKQDEYGSQPPIELIRQYAEYGGWYDRSALDVFVEVKNCELLCAMGPPGGGRNQITERLTSKFQILNLPMPDALQIKRVFSCILFFKMSKFDQDEIKANIEKSVDVIIDLFKGIQNSEQFKPTPLKSHYLFNMRDMMRVVQGMAQVDKDTCDSMSILLRLLIHENYRVYRDRMINKEDRAELRSIMNHLMSIYFQTSVADVLKEGEEEDRSDELMFVNFMDESKMYVEVKDHEKLRAIVEQKMEEQNTRTTKGRMDTVFFKDALANCAKINRIISLSNGHGLLIGEGGSGRHSLAKMASYLAKYKIYQIQITKNFNSLQFKQSMKDLFEQIALKKTPTTFLFSDNEITSEQIIEDINNILSLGEIPNLYSKKEGKDEFQTMREKLRDKNSKRETDEKIYDNFLNVIQQNLHIIFCISQSGPNLRNFGRQYPGLINNTTQIWFNDWPREALIQVARKYLDGKISVQVSRNEDEDEEEAEEVQNKNPTSAAQAKDDQDSFYADDDESKPEVDALEEERLYKEKVALLTEQKTNKIAEYFGNVHCGVIQMAEFMNQKIKRKIYITPKNFIDFVKEFIESMETKTDEIKRQILKYTMGLKKLEEAQLIVQKLSEQISLKTIESRKQRKKLDELDKELNKKSKNFAAEQKKMNEKNKIIQEETEKANRLKSKADEEKANLQPILDEALGKVAELKDDSQAFAEFKNLAKTKRKEVMQILRAIMVLMGESTTDDNIMRVLANNFVQKLNNINLDEIQKKTFDRFEKFTKEIPGNLSNLSRAVETMRRYVQAIGAYVKAFQDIQPTLEKIKVLDALVLNLNKELESLNEKLKKTQEENEKLQKDQLENQEMLKEAELQLKSLESELDTARNLVKNLEHSQESWKKNLDRYKLELKKIDGNVMIGSAFMNYFGPFPGNYRTQLLGEVKQYMVKSEVLHDPDWNFVDFQGKEIDILNWTFKGLPSDSFSKENGTIVMNSKRWPLMIDPQGQANKWIKELVGLDSILVIDPSNQNFMDIIKKSITNGYTVLLENVEEDLDPALDPILNKNLKTIDGKTMILFGELQYAYNESFKFYITTRLNNPSYKPEVSTKVTVVNFAVVQSGLEEQLLEVLLKIMNKKLESTRIECIKSKSECETVLSQLEDKILNMLQNSKTELVKDVELNKTLESSKEIEEKANQTISSNKNTLMKNDLARENYRPLGMIGSLLFFTIYNLCIIDNMYQFSLDSYVKLFEKTVDLRKDDKGGFSGAQEAIKEKIEAIDSALRVSVYDFACRGIFEKDKLLLSLQMAVVLAPIDEKNAKNKEDNNDKRGAQNRGGRKRAAKDEAEGAEEKKPEEDYYQNLFPAEWNFFLKGGVILNRENQPTNPEASWISQQMWDNIVELDKLPNFAGITGSFMHSTKEWKRYHMCETPEAEPLPSDWGTKIKGFSLLVLMRAIRTDRISFCAREFVSKTLGERFISPPMFDITKIYEESSHRKPTLFILSEGSDPWAYLDMLSKQTGNKITQVSLGQGQSTRAKDKIKSGRKDGYWLFLANIHLSRGFLKTLEKEIERIDTESTNKNFRLFLSANPSNDFPIAILQNSLKVTTEPPKGIKNNILKIYQNLVQDELPEGENITEIRKYKKLLFALSWFHSIVIERKKFKSLGWNVLYDFNDSDFLFSERLIRSVVDIPMDKSSNVTLQWDAIRYIISEINYGGRVTDPWDRRLLNQYSDELFVEELLKDDQGFILSRYKPDAETEYKVPIDPSDQAAQQMKGRNMEIMMKSSTIMKQLKEFYFIRVKDDYPAFEVPGVFFQHSNSEISSQREDAAVLLNSILSLQPKDATTQGKTREQIVLELVEDLYQKVPEHLNYSEIYQKNNPLRDNDPLKVVLLQETNRYNQLLTIVKDSFQEMTSALTGKTLASEAAEQMIMNFFENKVPARWKDAYHSAKPLSSWIADLNARITFINKWGLDQKPLSFWLGGFTFPTGFTTALKQKTARAANISIHKLKWEFSFTRMEVQQHPREGAYIHGIFIQGARWNEDDLLDDEIPMTLFDKLPTVLMKPVEKLSRANAKVQHYECPVYVYPIRWGTREKPSYLFPIKLPMSADYDESFFIKRGTACLLSLAD